MLTDHDGTFPNMVSQIEDWRVGFILLCCFLGGACFTFGRLTSGRSASLAVPSQTSA